MKRAIIEPAVLAGAALGELKDWLGVSTGGDDPSLTALLHAALEMCEAFTGLMPLAALCEEIVPASTAWQGLATRPVHAVTGVEGIAATGARLAIALADYAIDLTADGEARVRLVRTDEAERVAVRFSAGLVPGWTELPASLRHGVLRLAAHHYREREADGTRTMPPTAVAALWRPWRRPRVA